MVATIPALILEMILHVNDTVTIVIGAPVIEEAVKFLAVYLIFFRKKYFNEPMDGVVYAAAVALGFATLENIGYVLSAFLKGDYIPVSVMRAVLSVPGHFLFSTVWGYGLGLSKFRKGKQSLIWTTLLAAMLLHGAFNFLVTNISWLAIVFLIFMAFIWIVFFKNVAKLEFNSPFKRGKNKKIKK